jgi:HEAT repeat protein
MSAWIERGKQIPSVEAALIKIIRDKSSAQRRIAAFVVGRLGSCKALDALADVFEADDDCLHLDAVRAICEIKSPKQVDCLAKALESTYRKPEVPDRGIPTGKAIVRANVAIALSQIDDDSAKKLLTALLSREKDSYVLSVMERIQKKK